MKTSCVSPEAGKLKAEPPTHAVVPKPTEIAFAADGFVKRTFWFVLKLCPGRYMFFAGTDTVSESSPTVIVFSEEIPTIVPTPTASVGLKNLTSFTLESKNFVFTGMVKNWGTVKTGVEIVCAEPATPLLTLKIPLSPKTSRTLNLSVPIPMLLPTETEDGTDET